jgi:bifunctional DNA-binding transcriptional regulator/antitoxin component of YhaV-PrlF toxin-antitoxin module
MVKTRVSSKGQTTIPGRYRSRWKTSEVVWEDAPDGGAIVRPLPDIMALFGSAHTVQPRERNEKSKARSGWAEGVENKKQRP